MSTVPISQHPFGRLRKAGRGFIATLKRIGEQGQFYGLTLRSIADLMVHYKGELVRQIAIMSLGTGALAVIGGTVGVICFMTLSLGADVGVSGYNQFSTVGAEALVGFASSYFNVRFVGPVVTAIALAATLGAGATAQLGSMRISEEIDALEVMGIRSVAYLNGSRVVAGVIVVVPLYCLGLMAAFIATQVVTVMLYGQSSGVYNHYFTTFLNPSDIMWSIFQVVAMVMVIMLIHTYYGYNATGGPAGVGEAVGRAVRASLITTLFVVLFLSLAIYGQSGNFHLSD